MISGRASSPVSLSGKLSAVDILEGDIGYGLAAEYRLIARIEEEINRAKQEEGVLKTDIEAEEKRATDAEEDLRTQIREEKERAAEAEGLLRRQIQGEIDRALEVESKLDDRKLDKDGDGSAVTVKFEEIEDLRPLVSSSTTSVLFARLKKAVDVLIDHLVDFDNPHEVNQEQVGLKNVDNTSDINKPVSTAQRNAIDSAYQKAIDYINSKISDLIGGAPSTLDTLEEIANALAQNEDVVGALNDAIGTKANASDFNAHAQNETIHITGAERTYWNSKAEGVHTHDDRYYTETEINTKLEGKSDVGHTHDNRYYTEAEIDSKLSAKADTTALSSYYTKTETDSKLNSKVNTSTLNSYYTATQVDSKLSAKADTTALSSYLPLSGGTINGNDLWINGRNGAKGLYIGRNADIKESAGFLVNDGGLVITSTQDEATSTIYFRLDAKDTESGGGANAFAGTARMVGNKSGGLQLLDLRAVRTTWNLMAGDKVDLWTDDEGGNIQWIAPDGTKWEIDAYNGNARFFTYANGVRLAFTADKNGQIWHEWNTFYQNDAHIVTSLDTKTYNAGNHGWAAINFGTVGTAYVMLACMPSTNGVFTIGKYGPSFLLNWTSNTKVNANTNAVDYSITLLNESGNSAFPGNISAAGFYGNLTGTASNAVQAQNADKLDGVHADMANNPSTCVVRTNEGYVYVGYINSNSGNNENPTISQVIVTNGSDNFYRKASLAHLKSALDAIESSNTTIKDGQSLYIKGYNGNDYLRGRIWSNGFNLNIQASKLSTGSGNYNSYLNFQASHIQCRNSGDTEWVPIYASAYPGPSSLRYKENVKPITEERAKKILDLNVVSYDYKEKVVNESDRYNRLGVIAEETAEVANDAVLYTEINGEMVPDSVDYSRFVPYLIKMVQMQQEKIQELEEKILDLNSRIGY